MLSDWLYAGAGLILLLFGGDFLVRGAVNLSLRLGVPALIVSLTIVAFGTSAPELLVAVQAVLGGAPALALGNVIGSNTANVLLIMGIPALITVLHTSRFDSRASYVQMLAATALFIALAWRGEFDRLSGGILLGALALVLGHAWIEMRRHRAANAAEAVEGADPSLPGWKIGLFLALGLIALPVGANFLVDGAVGIARRMGVSEAAIGLTLVALGTSLPELATTVAAALRRQADVALGNVIGSNMFNLLGIAGIASLVGTIPVEPRLLSFDLWIMAGTSVLLLPFVFWRRDVTWRWGIALTGLYLAYVNLILG